MFTSWAPTAPWCEATASGQTPPGPPSLFSLYGGPVALTPREVNVEVVRLDPAMDTIVGPNPKIFKLAEGFQFTEGPVWIRDGRYLLFSDPNANRIYKYTADGTLSVFRNKSGYVAADIAEFGQPGSNGLTLDPQGRLTVNQHGNRRVIRVDGDGRDTVLADRYQGKRLNSPNDLLYRSDGVLFFTDPPFGLPKFHKDPRKELPFEGVFSLYQGKLRVVSTDMTGPNGIAFSPDEKYLYVGNWDDHRKVVFRFEVQPDATLGNGKVFFDMTSAPGEDAIDGLKVDEKGNLIEVILPIEEYRRLRDAAGEGLDPDEGQQLRPEVIEELVQMEADYAAGRLHTKPWEEVKRDLGLTDA